MMTGPPDERGSVRPVSIEGDERTYMCEVRAASRDGLQPGAIVWVEFGATWPEINGGKQKLAGQWRQCIVLPSEAHTASGVHVRLSPSTGSAPSELG